MLVPARPSGPGTVSEKDVLDSRILRTPTSNFARVLITRDFVVKWWHHEGERGKLHAERELQTLVDLVQAGCHIPRTLACKMSNASFAKALVRVEGTFPIQSEAVLRWITKAFGVPSEPTKDMRVIVMENVGDSLAAITSQFQAGLQADGSVIPRLLHSLDDLFGMLECAHLKDKVHGDITSRNLTVEPHTGKMWIIDYGLGGTAAPVMVDQVLRRANGDARDARDDSVLLLDRPADEWLVAGLSTGKTPAVCEWMMQESVKRFSVDHVLALGGSQLSQEPAKLVLVRCMCSHYGYVKVFSPETDEIKRVCAEPLYRQVADGIKAAKSGGASTAASTDAMLEYGKAWDVYALGMSLLVFLAFLTWRSAISGMGPVVGVLLSMCAMDASLRPTMTQARRELGVALRAVRRGCLDSLVLRPLVIHTSTPKLVELERAYSYQSVSKTSTISAPHIDMVFKQWTKAEEFESKLEVYKQCEEQDLVFA
jgi:hypothetical protein